MGVPKSTCAAVPAFTVLGYYRATFMDRGAEDMSTSINALLAQSWVAPLARILITFPFWLSGIVKTVDFTGAVAEMQHFGLQPPAAYAIATIVTQLVGSALVISGRAAWLGAGMLIVFTVLTIPIAHHFWRLTGEQAMMEMFFAIEHVALIGGLLLAAATCRRPAAERLAPLGAKLPDA